ncbi:aromatic ring-hydroxylating dioxygenase subunit alpha [Pusillimonas noertemannii]|uniref:Vanillate O-demethylase monooxygenase subunit n=1 Tax=Pusillimonas noertemannii TaxID=305977 RepID=A0A2U1CIP2_9BURK|nr:aromatic ring-hydroxylating dioxygenase subunit alpha [Pusillimonas noertemannii]NYT70732.1 aromatic ring-hydroxylating dioxygenase subunit alpha [Pusillimonas noertemannii]PVY60890.1 vanillate O-demethylase monooxygenase subunit [Pusillimonas noertemannii]TFL08520.1 aromatic ring-hydroxylating dioxygenase subunit alpha [Pusillimonas noertemannii]
MADYVLNTWYPIAWSRDISYELAKRRIVGKDVVLYRSSTGQVAAHLDVCPHRMAPLSMGRLKGDSIECGYHGMTFDCSGACIRIPGQRIVGSPAVETYPTHENMGLVWIWMGDPAKADTSLVYDLPQYHDPAWSSAEGDALEIGCHYLNLCDNLCDPAHVSFVHLSTLGTPAGEDIPVQMKQTDDGLLTWRWINDSPAIPLFQKFGNFKTNVDRWHYYHYTAPSIAVIDFGSAPTGTGAPEGNRDDCIQIYACHFMTPVDENTTIDHWLHVKNFKADEETNKKLSAEFRLAFSEDKTILEAIHQNEQRSVNPAPVRLAIDASPIRMRKMVDEWIKSERSPATAAAVQPEPSHA